MFTLPGAAAKETTTPAREQYIRLTHCLEERLSRCLGPAWIICGLDVLVGRWSDHVLAAGCVRSLKSHRAGFRYGQSTHLINRPPRGDRPELLDAVGADADIPVVEVVTVGSQWPGIRRILSPSARRLVAGAPASRPGASEVRRSRRGGWWRPRRRGGCGRRRCVGRGGLVADERQAGVEGGRLQAGVDDGAVLGPG